MVTQRDFEQKELDEKIARVAELIFAGIPLPDFMEEFYRQHKEEIDQTVRDLGSSIL